MCINVTVLVTANYSRNQYAMITVGMIKQPGRNGPFFFAFTIDTQRTSMDERMMGSAAAPAAAAPAAGAAAPAAALAAAPPLLE